MNIGNLVLSGGGIKGYTYIGVMKALEEKNITFKKIVGSSIGSFFSLLIILNYSSSELMSIFSKMNITFDDILSLNIDNIDIDDILTNLIYSYGIDSGDKVHNIIKIFIKNKIENTEITFKELYDYNNIELTVVVTNLSKNITEYCNYINTPDMKIHLAIRASISLPFIFNPVIIDNTYYIDGGITNNLPIDYISQEDIKKTLGISLTSLQTKDINSLSKYVLSIFKCYIGFLEIEKINKYKENILIIEQNCNPIETNMCLTEIHNLIDKGYYTTINYLNKLIETNINDESISSK
jgi:predicted acylesterase/phospholipase RssA